MDEQREVKRRINERKFGSWEELPGSGRRYSYKVEGRQGWTARYVKEVNQMDRLSQNPKQLYKSRKIYPKCEKYNQ